MPAHSTLSGLSPEVSQSAWFTFACLFSLIVTEARAGADAGPPSSPPPPPSTSVLVVVERSIVQDQGAWQVEYRLRHQGPTAIVTSPEEIQARVEGWVSNSRVASHAVPRLSSMVVAGTSASASWASSVDVIASADEAQRCRERATLQVWPSDEPGIAPLGPGKTEGEQAADPDDDPDAGQAERPPLLVLTSGTLVRVRLRLEHQHVLYGDYDPLLSQRQVELHLGTAALRDVVPMDREQYLVLPKVSWPAPPDDFRDSQRFISPPDSLHLQAHVPGNEHYRFAERPVRYATRMRLKFWYLVASGTEGECRVRVTQHRETPTMYKTLYDAIIDDPLGRVGRWVKVERVFRTEPEATSLDLEFKICDPDDTRIGEIWIDDISLEPVLAGPSGP